MSSDVQRLQQILAYVHPFSVSPAFLGALSSGSRSEGERLEVSWEGLGDRVTPGHVTAAPLVVPPEGIDSTQLERWARANGWPRQGGTMTLRRVMTVDGEVLDRTYVRQDRVDALTPHQWAQAQQLALTFRPKEPDVVDRLLEELVKNPQVVNQTLSNVEHWVERFALAFQRSKHVAEAQRAKVESMDTQLDAEIRKARALLEELQTRAAASASQVQLPAPVEARLPPAEQHEEQQQREPAAAVVAR